MTRAQHSHPHLPLPSSLSPIPPVPSLLRTTSTFPSSSSSSSYALDDVSRLHGFLSLRSIPLLILQSNYSRHELFAIFLRFKSLCCLSPQSGPGGIDARTFQRGVVRLSVEDDRFVHRVFALVDTDQSNSIEWEEFLVAMAALEKGSAEIKAKFACQVYDLDGDGYIGRQDLTTMFQASSMLKAGSRNRHRKEGGEEAKERGEEEGNRGEGEGEEEEEEEDSLSDAVIAMFVSKVFETFGCAESGLIAFEDVLQHIKSQQITCDVWDLFGRSMLHETTQHNTPHRRAVQKKKAKSPHHHHHQQQQHSSHSHRLINT